MINFEVLQITVFNHEDWHVVELYHLARLLLKFCH